MVRNRDRRPAESAAEEAGERAAAEAALREQLRRAAERHSALMAELDARTRGWTRRAMKVYGTHEVV